jgi:ABC-type sugar transport system ATPase subunit
MSFLRVSGISKAQDGRNSINQISFNHEVSRKLAIAGETGSGKTTLLKIIAGLVQPDEGSVFLENEMVMGPDETLVPGHPYIAYLSQHFELRNNYRVEEVFSYACQLMDADAAEIVTLCQVEHLLKRRTDQLSGGERQRIALARLLISSPKLLLLDEPFSNLDPAHKKTMKQVIDQVGSRLGISTILVSHDGADLLSWADDILVIKDGRLIQNGSPQMIYERPKNEYVAALFGVYNVLDRTMFQLLSGDTVAAAGKIMVRPESIALDRTVAEERRAEILEIKYFGSYYEVQVLYKQQRLTITTDASFKKGDHVSLFIKATDGVIFN